MKGLEILHAEEAERDELVSETIEVDTSNDYLEDDLLHMMIDLKQNMMEYVRYEKKPLLENFDMDIWIECLKCCLYD